MLCSGRFLRRNGNKEEEKMKNNNRFTTAQLTLLGLMAAILLLMAYTPLGYLNIGPLAISFNVIPVAISAVVLGPVGGAVAGAIFGLTCFCSVRSGGLQCDGSCAFWYQSGICFYPAICTTTSRWYLPGIHLQRYA